MANYTVPVPTISERATIFNILSIPNFYKIQQYHYHYFTDEGQMYKEVKWFTGGHRGSLCTEGR